MQLRESLINALNSLEDSSKFKLYIKKIAFANIQKQIAQNCACQSYFDCIFNLFNCSVCVEKETFYDWKMSFGFAFVHFIHNCTFHKQRENIRIYPFAIESI